MYKACALYIVVLLSWLSLQRRRNYSLQSYSALKLTEPQNYVAVYRSRTISYNTRFRCDFRLKSSEISQPTRSLNNIHA